MTLDAARALGHLHSFSVQQSDGKAFDATNYEETAYELPFRGRAWKRRLIAKGELFVLGSLIYEIVAWVKPSERGGITEIEEKLAQEVFPRLEGVVAGKAIERYWHGKREMSAETVAELQMIERDEKDPLVHARPFATTRCSKSF
ncbi:hypothetical protein F4823DRAFT_566961 [Ustulina deusta]|nr:hypothetical protein F4823DRAFT_566961 [Ustulina deusta]